MRYSKKRCPFVAKNPYWVTSKGRCIGAKCIVTYCEFVIKKKGFSVKHGCFNLAHQECEYFLRAILDEWWQSYLAEIGYDFNPILEKLSPKEKRRLNDHSASEELLRRFYSDEDEEL